MLTGTIPGAWPWVVTVGPAPALVDWWATTATDRRGSNLVRTASGTLLGLGYGVAVPWVLTGGPLWLFAVAAGYGGVAGVLLARMQSQAHSRTDAKRADGTDTVPGSGES